MSLQETKPMKQELAGASVCTQATIARPASGLTDDDDVRRSLELLNPESDLIEIRVLNDSGPPLYGFFDDVDKLIEGLSGVKIAKGIYFTLNPVHPSLQTRSENRIQTAGSGTCTSDRDVVARKWLLIDCDSERVNKQSSADDSEHEAALARITTIRQYLLDEHGWPEPVVADSGNGGHLLYRIDLPTDDDGLVKQVLMRLAELFDDDVVKVDKSVHNPARICKMYGTLACKGEDTPERPHRMSRILEAPGSIEIVTSEQLEALAGVASPKLEPAERRVTTARFNVESFINRNNLDVDGPKDWNEGGRVWRLSTSPMCDHGKDGPYIAQFANGAISAGCHHDSCTWDWHDLRDKLEPRGSERSDTANARRLADRHGNDLRYCFAFQKWLYWDGSRWKIDDRGEVMLRAKDTARAMHVEASREGDPELAKWARTSESNARLNAMIALAECELPVTVDELDAQPWYFNCLNGTVDLRTGELHRHRREDLLTKLSPVPFDKGAKSELWHHFLHKIFDGKDELIRFVQQIVGLAMAGEVRDNILPICYGTGANGKSVLLDTISGMFGPDYAMNAPSGLLMASKSSQHPTELADLFGRRLVTAVETPEGHRLSETLVKELTGGDPIRARRMREDFWEFRPSHTFLLATNHKPVIKGTDNGIWRRLLLIPFDVVIPEAEQDKELGRKLREQWPGILQWAIAGCLAWQQGELQKPEEVTAATNSYRSDMDILGAFIEERCNVSETASAGADELYRAYQEWAQKLGEDYDTQRRFGAQISERGFQRARITSGDRKGRTKYAGIELALAV